MSDAVGAWAIEMSTPIGRQSFVLELSDAPPAGWVHNPEGRADLTDVVIVGDTARFALAIDKPMKLATKWVLTASGDQITGTVRAGIMPALMVSGVRVPDAAGATHPAPTPTPVPAHTPHVHAPTTSATWTRAAVLRTSDGRFVLEDVQLEAPGPHQVLVRLVAAGMCHTDMVARATWQAPIILGHEGAGVVEAIGSAVTTLAVGDHVILTFDSCGACRGCRAGRPFDCVDFELLNLGGRGPGVRAPASDDEGTELLNRWFGQSSFAEHCLANERNAIRVDADLPLDVLAPLGCGVMTGAGAVLNVMRLRVGQRLAVFGAGAVGLSAVMAAKASGAAEIVAVDVHANRRALALELGATRVVDPDAVADLAEAVIGDGEPFDFAFDTSARESVMLAATEVIGRPGLCVLVGAGFEPLTVLPASLAGKTITYAYLGESNPAVAIPALIGLWRRGLLPVERLEQTFDLAAVNEAEHASASGRVIKPVLVMRVRLDSDTRREP